MICQSVGDHGGTDVFDQFALQSNWNNFGVGDLDRSGVVDAFDLFVILGDYGAAEPNGNISLPAEDNIHGYTGGVFDSEAQIYLFRNRYYADWRVVYEEVDDDFISSPSSLTRKIEYHHGLRGLNDILLKRASTTLNNDSPNMAFEQVRYYATDSQFSVRAVIGENAQVVERVSYDAYGQARHHRAADIVPNTVGDHGGTDVFDQFALQSNWNNFGVGDLDRSGVVDAFDLFVILGDYGAAEPNGNISLPAEDNIHGYTGGIFDSETQIYLFRNRYYDPSLGRFIRRDTAVFVEGCLTNSLVPASRFEYISPN